LSEEVSKREIVAQKVAERFNRLPPDKKRKFVDDTLTELVNMSRQQMQKLFKKIVRKGRPSEKDLELLNQLIVVFIYSVRPEYQFHYASMIYKSLKMPLPTDIPEKLQRIRQVMFLSDIGVSLEVYHRLFEDWTAKGSPPYNDYFTQLLNRK
jgi:DNA-directed RNA polymerase subunit F